jgi:hypothetical protein
MKPIPTAMEVLLNLTPLDLLIMAEARMALYRLLILKQPGVPKGVSGKMWVTLYKTCGRTTPFQSIVTPTTSGS